MVKNSIETPHVIYALLKDHSVSKDFYTSFNSGSINTIKLERIMSRKVEEHIHLFVPLLPPLSNKPNIFNIEGISDNLSAKKTW